MERLLSQILRLWIRACGSLSRETSCIRHALWPVQMNSPMTASGKMILYIAFLDESHGNSGRSVVCLEGARLKRSLECRRREGKTMSLLSIR